MDRLPVNVFGIFFIIAIIWAGIGSGYQDTYVTTMILQDESFLMDTFTCDLEVNTNFSKFSLNVTVDTSTNIFDTVGATVHNKSHHGYWFFLEQTGSQIMQNTSVTFELWSMFREPKGNCTWHLYDEVTSLPENTTFDDCGVNADGSQADSCGENSVPTTTEYLEDATPEFTTQNTHTEGYYTYTDPPQTTENDQHTSTESSTQSEAHEPVTSLPVMSPEPTENSTCLCRCHCAAPLSLERAGVQLKNIIKELQIHKNSTALAKRKKACASDKRLLSRGIGFVGVLVLIVVFGVILIGDAKLLVRDAKRMLDHLKRIFCCQK